MGPRWPTRVWATEWGLQPRPRVSGPTRTVVFNGVTLAEGPHTIHVVVDAENGFAEDDETNNAADLAVTCAAA